MKSNTFRKWLVEHACYIDQQVMITVHREGRKTEVPLGGSHQVIDTRVMRRACGELGLNPAQLPGPKGPV
jgi:hypothetical protein